MSLLNFLRSKISPRNPLLLLYHRFLAIAAAVFYRFPANHLKVIAVTGTSGKSTVIHLLANILKEAGHRVGLASTIQFQIGELVWPNDTKMTTLGRFALQKLLRGMVKAKCEFALLEVTSQALTQSRLWGVNVDMAILTNILRDHLEYHGGFENYLHAKGLLFSQLARSEKKFNLQKTAVLPSDDPHVSFFETFSVERKISYGGAKGIIHASDVILQANGSRFTIKVPNGAIGIHLKLPGEFNISNALAASAAALSLGIKVNVIQKGLQQDFVIPGRIEMIRAGQPFTVVVDYAHTPEALEKVLSLFRPITKGRIFLVFGAPGGGRDASKRPAMGKVAVSYADFIVVTDDDPYAENRMQIMEQIAAGIEKKEGQNFWMIRDRRQAIRFALSLAQEHDAVLITGKGCEPVQVIGEKHIPWDDRKVVREILSTRLEVEI